MTSSPPLPDEAYLPSSPPLPQTVTTIRTQQNSGCNSYPTRPNRYLGPESTWLTYTRQERGVVQSIDDERSQNLGLHLLNAHSLQRATKSLQPVAKTNRKGKQPADLGSDDDDELTNRGFSTSWTTWPLPPEYVPREEEDFGSGDVGGSLQDPRPSAWLEDQLLAHVTKVARRRWNAREWAPKEERVQKKPEVKQQNSQPEETRPPPVAHHESSSDSELGEGMLVSQVYLADADDEDAQGDKSKAEDYADSDDEDQTPTPLEDDDVARQLLLPSIRQTLSKLDGLLMALHKSRISYSVAMPRDHDGYETEDGETTATDASRSRKRRRARSQSRGRSMAGARESESVKQPKRQLNPRDWSDVLGMATLIGWNNEAVGFAAEKCANLFEENMMFRAFHEPRPNETKPLWEDCYASAGLSGPAGGTIRGESQVVRVRSSAACKSCYETSSRCQPDPNPESNSTSCMRCELHYLECSGIEIQINGLTCPYRDCDRHRVPLSSANHWRRHMADVHGEDPPPPSSPNLPSSASESYRTGNREFLCPVKDCSRHQRPFVEGSKMYRHIRNMHPEVDVEEVKRLEILQRGEKRGKWRDTERRRINAQRSRSRSMGVASSSPRRGRMESDSDGDYEG